MPERGKVEAEPGVKRGVAGAAESERNGFQGSVSDDPPRLSRVEDVLEDLYS